MSLAAVLALALVVLPGCGDEAPAPWEEGARLCPLGGACDEKPADPIVATGDGTGGASGRATLAGDAGEEP